MIEPVQIASGQVDVRQNTMHCIQRGNVTDLGEIRPSGFSIGYAFEADVARLWAASPDLLEACKLALGSLQRSRENPPLEVILAIAISKATGEVNPYGNVTVKEAALAALRR